jgi:homoserine kinase
VSGFAGLVGREIVVPGSVSNLGPGFDTLSVAVQVYLRLRILDVREGVPDTIETRFTGAAPAGENRIETAFRHARARIGQPAPGVVIEASSDIPTRAGLGSSGAATVAGLQLYSLLTSAIDPADLLALASDVEGHPDNAAAALLGGLTVSCQREDGRVIARSWAWPSDIQLVVATPSAELETAHARRVLPDTIPLRDGIFNLQRALLLVHALQSGEFAHLAEALRDRWHQPARASLVPGLPEALTVEDDSVLGVCLSGAGPSIVMFTNGRTEGARASLDDIYRRVGVPATIRVLSAHQPVGSSPLTAARPEQDSR